MTPKVRISEIFASLQGEGVWAGTPSVFVRTSGCNLRCRWCDTPYASWNPEGPVMEVDSIVEKVDSFGVRHAVITGGEPMIFDATEALATRLKELGYTITIETAGTVFRSLPCDLMSISPKLANSTPEDGEWADRHETTRFNPQAIARLIATYPYQLKFVVNPEIEGDLPEIDEMLAAIGDVDQSHILLMPEGTDSETLWRRARLLIEPCMQRNWRLAPRLHIDLFGNKRGT